MTQETLKITSVVLEGEGSQMHPVTREMTLDELRRDSDIGKSRVCAPCMAFETRGQSPGMEAIAREAIAAVQERLSNCRQHLDKPLDTIALHNMVGILKYITQALHSAQVYFAEQRFGAAAALAQTLKCDFDTVVAGVKADYPPLRGA